MTWTYAKFIEKYGDCIEETEDEFNAIIEAEKARLKLNGKKFDFNELLKFHFKFPGKPSVKMRVHSYKKNPTVSVSERKANQSIKSRERQANPETSTFNIEDISIKRLMEITKDTNLEFKEVGREGCYVDLAVRKKGISRHTWFPIQIKATNGVIPKFVMKRYNCPNEFKNTYERFGYYDNMIVICYNILIDEFLIIPPYSTKIPNSTLKYNSGVTKGYYVKKDNIVAKINEYIETYSKLEKSFSELELLCNENKKLEIKYIRIRQETLSKVFDMEEINFCAVDFIIDGFVRVQEKTKNYKNNIENSFEFTLKKGGKNNNTHYCIDDNEFYWFNLAGTDYFYVIPSNSLKDEKDKNKIRQNLMLHKEFKTEKENKRRNYNDAWTYDFRFDRTKPDDMLALWCLVYGF